MRRLFVIPLFGSVFVLLAALSGCAGLGVQSPFGNDPLTGGTDTSTSALLNVPVPAGFQRYSSHGFSRLNASGGREGLETLRGNVDEGAAEQAMFSALRGTGWQLRLALRKGNRSIQAYSRDKELAVLVYRRQGMLTILEIWVGQRLPDGATLDLPGEDGGLNGSAELAGEEYGPLDPASAGPDAAAGSPAARSGGSVAPVPGAVETWGGSTPELEERAL